MYSTSLTALTLLAAGIAHAQTTHDVMTTDALAFEPNMLENVAMGDMVRVQFGRTIPHSIVSGSWGSPCVYDSAGGLNSGVQSMGQVFTFMVNSTDPQVYFCSVGRHCPAGMALAINPMGDNTIEAYQAGAKSSTTKGPSSEGPAGGVLRQAGDNSSSMMAGSSSMMSGSSSMMAGSMSTMAESMSTMSGSMSTMAASSSMMAESTSAMAGMSTTASAAAQSTGGAAGLGSGSAMIGAIVAGGLAFVV